jgi:hypothetical protein
MDASLPLMLQARPLKSLCCCNAAAHQPKCYHDVCACAVCACRTSAAGSTCPTLSEAAVLPAGSYHHPCPYTTFAGGVALVHMLSLSVY